MSGAAQTTAERVFAEIVHRCLDGVPSDVETRGEA